MDPASPVHRVRPLEGGIELHEVSEERGWAYFAVGITNSAPLPMLSGQRCMMLFCLV